ncbi:MAG: hypothetical protein ACE5G0_11475 [Rhodothermales bacterium]
MARFLVFLVVVGSTSFVMYATKPTKEDYLAKLDNRAEVVESQEHNAFSELRGGHPIDEMVAAQGPMRLLEQTRIDDYVLFSVFTTEYEVPGHGPQRVRTYGLFSSLISSKLR